MAVTSKILFFSRITKQVANKFPKVELCITNLLPLEAQNSSNYGHIRQRNHILIRRLDPGHRIARSFTE